MFFENFSKIFWKFCVFWLFIVPTGIPFQRKWFSWKNSPDLLVFWLWFSPPSEKIFRNLCILKINWRFFENSAPFLCSKATIDHAASGWCAAVIFWKKATRFAGFLVVIFTSQSKNLQQFLHSEKNLGNFWRLCNFFIFSFCRLEFLSKGSDFLEKIHQICWFPGCDFHLPAKKSSEIYAFWKKSGDFLEILHLLCVQKLL